MTITTRPGAPPVPRPGPGAAQVAAGAVANPLVPDAITQAGRIADRFLGVRRSLFAAAGEAAEAAGAAGPGALWTPGAAADAPPTAAPAAKPSKANARAAHQQAVLGVRLGQQGRHADAIAPLRRSVELDPTVAMVQHDLGFACLQAGRLEEAESAFAAAIRLNPDLASAHNHLAVALDRRGRVDLAFKAYEAAVKLEPERHAAQFRLGQIHLWWGRWAAAVAAFRAAAAAAPSGSTEARISAACAADAAGDGAAAQGMLRAAIAADPASGTANLILGQMLFLAGQSAEAAVCLERAIALMPEAIAAWQAFATNTKFTAADRALIERIRAGLERPGLTTQQRRALHFALGKAHDDIGEYAEAMRHFDAGNRIRAAIASLNRPALARQTGWVIAHTPKGHFERRPDLGVADETPVLIVGMPRSGTTLVEQILSSHPDVAPGGELNCSGVRGTATASASWTPARSPRPCAGWPRTISRCCAPSRRRRRG